MTIYEHIRTVHIPSTLLRALHQPPLSSKSFKILSLELQDAALDFPPYQAKVFTSEPICIVALPDSSTLLSGPGLSPPPPHRFRLVTTSHSRTQSLPDQKSTSDTLRHVSSLDQEPSPYATVSRPSYLSDPETPGLYFTGRESDHTFIDPPPPPQQKPHKHAKQLHHRYHSDSAVRSPRNRRLRYLRHSKPCESIREEGEGSGRGGRHGGVEEEEEQEEVESTSAPDYEATSAVEIELEKTINELKRVGPSTSRHKHSRTKSRDLIPQGIAKARISSFEDKEKIEARPELRRTSSIMSVESSRKVDLSPPIVFSPQSASQRDWTVPSTHRNMVRSRVPSVQGQESEDGDLDISNDELLATHSASHGRTQSLSPRSSSEQYNLGHGRCRSMSPTPTMIASFNKPPSPFPSRLVPANTHHTNYPSAFRIVPVDSADGRPGSSGSDSTVSSAGPATPKSGSSSGWLDWSLSLLSSPLGSPKRPSSPTSPVPSQIFAAQLTYGKNAKSELDREVPTVTKGIRDHWADIVKGHHRETSVSTPNGTAKRTVSRQVQWEDEQSVRFSWF